MPINHKTKAQHVKNTWGRGCNRLVFISTENDTNLGAIGLNLKESRRILWDKMKSGFEFVYENYFNDTDWFLKGDDDSYFIIENLRYILAQYHPQTSLYIGHRFALSNLSDGYMAGGGYILSKKALSKFVTKLLPNPQICHKLFNASEDTAVGLCLQNEALFIDGIDSFGQSQFFPIGMRRMMLEKLSPACAWYTNYTWTNYKQGSLDCCSASVACFHYVKPKKMYFHEFLVYKVHPFGVEKVEELKMPKQLTMDEILRLSERKSLSPVYQEHEFIHHMDDDEIF